MTQTTHDVLVVGCGLNGLVLTQALHSTPCRVAVVDQRDFTAPVPAHLDERQIVLSATSRTLLESLGLWAGLSSYAHPIHQVTVTSTSCPHDTLNLRAQDDHVPALGYAFPGAALFNHLIDASNSTNTDRYPEHTLKTLTMEDNVHHLHTIDASGNACTLTAPLLVAVDGERSWVRTQRNMTWHQDNLRTRTTLANVRADTSLAHTSYQCFHEGAIHALIPCHDGGGVAIVSTRTNHPSSTGTVEQLLHPWRERWPNLTCSGEPTTWESGMGWMPYPADDHVVYLGNAAMSMPPVAAQGFNLGLRDVGWFATALCHSLSEHGGDPERACGDTTLPHRYAQHRLPDMQAMKRVMVGLAHTGLNNHRCWQQLQPLGFRAIARMPWLHPWITRWGLGRATTPSPLASGVPWSTYLHQHGVQQQAPCDV